MQMSLLWVRRGTPSAVRLEAKVFPLLILIISCCANRVSEEYRGEKEPKVRRGNQALLDWISLVPWYVFISLPLSTD